MQTYPPFGNVSKATTPLHILRQSPCVYVGFTCTYIRHKTRDPRRATFVGGGKPRFRDRRPRRAD